MNELALLTLTALIIVISLFYLWVLSDMGNVPDSQCWKCANCKKKYPPWVFQCDRKKCAGVDAKTVTLLPFDRGDKYEWVLVFFK